MDERNVKISEEVVAKIASIATLGVDGVIGMGNSGSAGLASLLGKISPVKNVKVSLGEGYAEVDIAMTVEYGFKIPDVALNVQQRVKEEIESMTGLSALKVNVNIIGISLSEDIAEGVAEASEAPEAPEVAEEE